VSHREEEYRTKKTQTVKAPSTKKNDGSKWEEPSGGISDHNSIPIVGMGASAGGLEALEQFFKNMPQIVE